MHIATTLHVVPETPTFEPPPEEEAVDLRPHSAYEVLTRQLVDSLAGDVREIKSRLNGLIFTTAGAILIDVVTRLLDR